MIGILVSKPFRFLLFLMVFNFSFLSNLFGQIIESDSIIDLNEELQKSLEKSNTLDVYGRNCGIAGIDPPLRKNMEEFISNLEFAQIDSWLISDNPAKQVYAVEALYILKNRGISPSDYQKSLINNMKYKNDLVQTCSGCIHLSQPIAEIIARFSFD